MWESGQVLDKGSCFAGARDKVKSLGGEKDTLNIVILEGLFLHWAGCVFGSWFQIREEKKLNDRQIKHLVVAQPVLESYDGF